MVLEKIRTILCQFSWCSEFNWNYLSCV